MAETKGKLDKSTPGALNWFKNVAKSLGYTSADLVTEIAPSMGEFIGTTAEYGQELRSELSEMKSGGGRIKDAIKNIAQVDIAQTALRNAIEDIKSGKIYNREREEAMHQEDWESDDGFGMEDFEFGGTSVDVDESPSSEMPTINIKTTPPPINRNSPIVKVMEHQTKTIARSTEATNNVNTSLAASDLMMAGRIGSGTLHGIQAVNENVGLLVKFHNDSTSKYIGASLKFYEDNLQVLGDTLEQIRLGNGGGKEEEEKSRPENPMDQIFLSGGGLNLKGYTDYVKKNLQNEMSSNPVLAPLKMMFEDTNALKFMAASPLSFISTKIVTTLIPKFLEESVRNLDKTFAAFFPALMMRINRELSASDNPILSTIGKIFGINTASKSFVDLSRYDKGPIPFDGYTKKAITDVIPSYLRKILATLTGQQEIAFDYEKGQFRSMEDIEKSFQRDKDFRALYNFSDAIDTLQERSKSIQFADEKDRQRFNEGLNTWFLNLSKRDHLAMPDVYVDKDGIERDDLRDIFDFGDSGLFAQFRDLFENLSRREKMDILGNNVLNARKDTLEFMREAEENPMIHNAALLFNNLNANEHMKRDANGNLIESSKGNGHLNQTDKYNLSSLDYLRSIQKILLQGIQVFPISPLSGGAPPTESEPTSNPTLDAHKKIIEGMINKEKELREKQHQKESANTQRSYSESEIDSLAEKGIKVVDSTYTISEMQEQGSLKDHNLRFQEQLEQKEKSNQQGGIGQWLGKFLKGDSQEKYNLMRQQVDSILQKPAQLLKSVFDKIDNVLYDVVFGSSDKEGQTSFMDKTLASLRERFAQMGTWTQEKILNPMKEALFGEEGMFTKMKESDFNSVWKQRMSKVAEFMFGTKNTDGKREGGLMSDTANEMLDMWDHARYYFTGSEYTNRKGQKFEQNPNSVFGEVKTIFGNFKNDVKHYLVGDKEAKDPDNQRGVLSGGIESIKMGFRNFTEAIFGPRAVNGKDAEMLSQETWEKIKLRAPKALAMGTIGAGVGVAGMLGGGLLGTLVGGPVAGAVLGSTVGFLSQSDRFNNWLFGEKDPDGNRVGGIINKTTTDFLKKNRLPILAGAGLGAAKSALASFGLLPAFFLPGGPIAGAALGVGTALMIRSEAFQKMMFGEKDADGKRMGGVIHKLFGKEARAKNILGNVGAGTISGAALGLVASNMGLLGTMLVPGGPIGGAILGAAAGIALSSDKWKKALFGEWDEETGKRKGGLLGKFQNWFKLEVMSPLQLKMKEINLNVKEWFTESIGNPFLKALSPIRTEFKYMTDRLNKFFIDGWESFKTKLGDVFEKNVGIPFGRFMEEKVMKPLRGFFSKLINGVGKVFGTVLSSPFKAMESIASGYRDKQEKRGLKQMRDDEWDYIKDVKGRRERGERMGLFRTKDKDGNVIGKGIFGRINDMYLNKEAKDDARFGENGAHYARKEDEEFKKREAAQKKKFAEEREKIEREKSTLDLLRRIALKHDYDNFTAEGLDISRIYNGKKDPANKENTQPEIIPTRTLESKLGINIKEILGLDADANVDMTQLSKKEKKKLSKAIRNNLTPNAVKKLFGTDQEEKVEEKTDQPSTEVESVTEDKSGAIISSSIDGMKDTLSDTIKEESPKEEVKEGNKILRSMYKLMSGRKDEPTIEPNIPNPSQTLAEKLQHNPFAESMIHHAEEKPESESLEKVIKPIRSKKKRHKKKQQKKLDIMHHDDEHSHASGLDNVPHDEYEATLHKGEMVVPAAQANAIRQAMGQPTQDETEAVGELNDSNKLVNSIPTLREDEVRMGYQVHHDRLNRQTPPPNNKSSLLSRIATDVRAIAQEVHGQLDGVGSNIFKIRKLVQKQTGGTDADMTGSANRDRVGFFGNLRRMMYSPLDAIKTQLLKGVHAVVDKFKAVGESIARVGRVIVEVPTKIIQGIGSALKEIGGIAKETVLSVIKIPGKIVDAIGAGLNVMKEGMKVVGPAIAEGLKGAVAIFSGALKGAGQAISGFGKGVGAFFAEAGKGAGKVLTEFGKMSAGLINTLGKTVGKTLQIATGFTMDLVKLGADFTLSMTKKAVDVTVSTVTFIGQKLADVGKSLFELATSPLKFLGKALGKMLGKQEVIVKGGSLDSVGVVHVIGGDYKVPTANVTVNPKENTIQRVVLAGSEITLPVIFNNDETDKLPKKDDQQEIVPVSIASVADYVPVNIKSDSMSDAFEKIFPLPVEVENEDEINSPQVAEAIEPSNMITPLDTSDSLAGSLEHALETFDSKNDKEEAKKESDKSFTEKLEGKKEFASRKTASYQLEQLAIKEEKDQAKAQAEKQISLLEKIAGSTTEHKDGWMKVFGPKGLLTTALLLALPFLKDIIGAIKNILFPGGGGLGEIIEKAFSWGEKNDESRQDVDADGDGQPDHIANGGWREALVKGALRDYTRLAAPKVSDAAEEAKKGANVLGSLGRALAQSKLGQAVKDYWGKKTAKPDPNQLRLPAPNQLALPAPEGYEPPKPTIKQRVVESAQKVKEYAGEKVSVAGDLARTVATSLQKDAEKIRNSILDSFKKFFANSKLREVMGKAIGPAEKEILSTIGRVFSINNVIKHRGKLSKGFLKTGLKATGAFLTAGISQAAFTTWDLTTGGFEAANMFVVDEDTVDAKMRIVSGVTKALFAFIPLIDIMAEIFLEQTGYNMKQYVANALYAAIASTEEQAELENAQNTFEQEWKDYNEKNGTNLSLNAYNDKMNKSVWQKLTEPIANAFKAMGSAGKWIADKTGITWAANKVKDAAINVWDGTKFLAKNGFQMAFNYKEFRDKEIRENLDIKDDRKLTDGQVNSHRIAEFIEGATLGLIDAENTAKGIYGFNLKVGDWYDNFKKDWGKQFKSWGDTISDTLSEWKDRWIDRPINAVKDWWKGIEKRNDKDEDGKILDDAWNDLQTRWAKRWNNTVVKPWNQLDGWWEERIQEQGWDDNKDGTIDIFEPVKKRLSKIYKNLVTDPIEQIKKWWKDNELRADEEVEDPNGKHEDKNPFLGPTWIKETVKNTMKKVRDWIEMNKTIRDAEARENLGINDDLHEVTDGELWASNTAKFIESVTAGLVDAKDIAKGLNGMRLMAQDMLELAKEDIENFVVNPVKDWLKAFEERRKQQEKEKEELEQKRKEEMDKVNKMISEAWNTHVSTRIRKLMDWWKDKRDAQEKRKKEIEDEAKREMEKAKKLISDHWRKIVPDFIEKIIDQWGILNKKDKDKEKSRNKEAEKSKNEIIERMKRFDKNVLGGMFSKLSGWWSDWLDKEKAKEKKEKQEAEKVKSALDRNLKDWADIWISGIKKKVKSVWDTFEERAEQEYEKEKKSNRDSRASGLDNVPYDEYPVNLHKGEMVIPAAQANTLRAMLGKPLEEESRVKGPLQMDNMLVNSIPSIDDLGGRIGSSINNNVSGINSEWMSMIGDLRKGMQDGIINPLSKSRKDAQGGFGNVQVVNGGVYYSQKDSRWANESFASGINGDLKMDIAGCGPATASMLMSTITGKEITPEQTLAFAQENGFVDSTIGTRPEFFPSVGMKYGVPIRENGTNVPSVVSSLASNKPVILSGRGSAPFTKAGHYVVATGLSEDGSKVFINDPLSESRSKAYPTSMVTDKLTNSFVTGTSPGGFGITTPAQDAAFAIGQGFGAFDGYRMTSPYGMRNHPKDGVRRMHRGVDLVKAHRSPIGSFTNGKVIFAGTGGPGSGYNNYGRVVAVKDENGYTHVYAHLDSISAKVGQQVKVGDIVGRQGNTGLSFGSHLHYEVRKGGYGTDVNPGNYMTKYKPGKVTDSVPTPSNDTASAPTSPTEPAEDPTVLELFGKMGENFNLYVDNVYQGTNNGLTWGDPAVVEAATAAASATSSATSVNGYNDATIKTFAQSKPYKGKYDTIINKYAKVNNLEPQLIAAMIQQESKFNPKAVSPAGAKGLMQLMPGTAREQGTTKPFDPDNNVMGGSKYIRKQINKYKDLKLALAAYNAGPGNVDKYGRRIPPFTETQNYVKLVMGYLGGFRKEAGGFGDLPSVGQPSLPEGINFELPTNPPKLGGGFGDLTSVSFPKAPETDEFKVPDNIFADGKPHIGGGEDPVAAEAAKKIISQQSNVNKERLSVFKELPTFKDQKSSSPIIQPIQRADNAELFKAAIDVLREIAGHTGETSKNMETLSKKEFTFHVTTNTVQQTPGDTQSVNNQTQVTPVVVQTPSQTYNVNPVLGAISDGKTQSGQQGYSVAKSIAGGRIN